MTKKEFLVLVKHKGSISLGENDQLYAMAMSCHSEGYVEREPKQKRYLGMAGKPRYKFSLTEKGLMEVRMRG